jgi:hypothetical protein
MKNIFLKLSDKELKKIIKYYYLDNIINDNSRQNLLKIINNNLYIDENGYIKKSDYENRYKLLKGSLLNGNDNEQIKNELSLF